MARNKQAITRSEGRNGARGMSIPAAISMSIREALDPSRRAGPVKTWAQMTEQEREEIRRQTQRGYTLVELLLVILLIAFGIVIIVALFKGAMLIIMGRNC